MIKEFKEFISKGNVIDLAVGVVIGGAFGAIVTSLVEDIIMPLIGLILGGLNFAGLSIKVGEAEIMYGNFIQVVVNFLIISFCIFMVIKAINKVKKPQEVEVTTKVCPYCKSEISIEATRCPHCTSELDK